MYAQHHGFGDTQGLVPAFEPRFGASPAQNAWLVLKHAPDGPFTQAPELCEFRDGVVLFAGQFRTNECRGTKFSGGFDRLSGKSRHSNSSAFNFVAHQNGRREMSLGARTSVLTTLSPPGLSCPMTIWIGFIPGRNKRPRIVNRFAKKRQVAYSK